MPLPVARELRGPRRVIQRDLFVPLGHVHSAGKVVTNRHHILPPGEDFLYLGRRAADQQELRLLDEIAAVAAAAAAAVAATAAAPPILLL